MNPTSFLKLKKRKSEGNFRELSSDKYSTDFYSNDYLGISRILQNKNETSSGSTGSRLISGNSKYADYAEKYVADFFEVEAALIFNSGYDANLGLMSSISERHDTIFYDEYVHASIRDGIRLGLAKSYSFKHNNFSDLEQKISKNKSGNVFIVIESLYSMDGDISPLKEIVNLCDTKGYFLIIDEAHACGVYGDKGKGLVDLNGINKSVFARIITFGKAYGTHGAAILGSNTLKDYLINFSRSFIYTTALPPSNYQTIVNAIDLSVNEDLRLKLFENIIFFRKKNNLDDNIISPIQTIQFDSINATLKKIDVLKSNSIGAKIILSPTVPKGKERIRICLHTFNSKKEIEFLCELLNL